MGLLDNMAAARKDRRQKRHERKLAKVAGRTARTEARQAGRTARRGKRIAARKEGRRSIVAERQAEKTKRAASRQATRQKRVEAGTSIGDMVHDFTVEGPLGFMDRGGLAGVMGAGSVLEGVGADLGGVSDDYVDDYAGDTSSELPWTYIGIGAAVLVVVVLVMLVSKKKTKKGA
jgi:Flp pilus assembly protein TadB